ncbi:MAG: hypothetical protein IM638_04460 [Bacteroidetes bacterium]|nr:hypothetical protein [Bacteroidota bacterium]
MRILFIIILPFALFWGRPQPELCVYARMLHTGQTTLSYHSACKPEHIIRIDVRPGSVFSMFPGQTSAIEADVIYEYKGKNYQKSTDAHKRRKRISFSELQTEVKGGSWLAPNLVKLNDDLSGLENGELIIIVKHKKAHKISGEWRTKIDFSLPLNINATGNAGNDATMLKTLLFGGRDASDPENGDCKKCARDGVSGTDGKPGGAGHALQVLIKKVTLKNAPTPLLAILVKDITANTEQLFMRNTAAMLVFDVTGGVGGSGANGGSGGDGLIADVNNTAVCCPAADGGNGGDGGEGGDGGHVEFVLDTNVTRGELNIAVYNKGGNGGTGGFAGKGGSISGYSSLPNACAHLQNGKNGTDGVQGKQGMPGAETIYTIRKVQVAAFQALEK